MWGFITCLNDILIPYLKGAFQLSYTQAMLVQFCFFGAYFIVSIPAGNLVSKIGFQKGIVFGLFIAALGCVMFVPAAIIGLYEVFLLALFVLACGITILQVSANPYVSALGKPETAPSRLTLTQAFNSLGTTIAPFFGAYLLFSSGQDTVSSGAEAVQVPYLLLAAALGVLAIVFSALKLPKLVESKDESSTSTRPLTDHPHLILGAIGIFLYVGAEVSIGSFLVSFLHQPSIAGLNEAQAAKLIAYYWGGAMIGRFIGAAVMQKVSGGKVLAFNGVVSMGLIIFAVNQTGALAMWAMLAVGLFNSIMFPTIFSLAISGLGKDAGRGSGLLCLAIVGGAIIPILQGVLADNIGLNGSFFLPATCYIFITYFGLWGCHKKSVKETAQ
ncbi:MULTISPECIES: sugar MFS transporter [Pseudoalteromonas]|nr:sugar MFS transporter [Pseudoalteromonas sp. Of7M-16]